MGETSRGGREASQPMNPMVGDHRWVLDESVLGEDRFACWIYIALFLTITQGEQQDSWYLIL